MVEGARTPLTVDLTGYKVAISAGANGIGKVMADSFSYCGAQVFVSDVDTKALEACGHPGMPADAGDPTQCEAFIDAAGKAAMATRAHGLAVETEAMDLLKEKGVTVINCDREAFRQRVLPQTDAFVKAHPEAKPIVDAVRATAA